MKVNEFFVSLQGEGHFTGTPSFFLRLSGCNLQCPFCDTSHQTFMELSEDTIVEEASREKPANLPCNSLGLLSKSCMKQASSYRSRRTGLCPFPKV